MKIGIASLEWKVVKNANQCTGLLFIDVEFLPDFPCKLCSNE
jgi:hypothetical protein